MCVVELFDLDAREMSVAEQFILLEEYGYFSNINGVVCEEFLTMKGLDEDLWGSISGEHGKSAHGRFNVFDGPVSKTIGSVTSGLSDFDLYSLPQSRRREVGGLVSRLCAELIDAIKSIPEIDRIGTFHPAEHRVIDWFRDQVEIAQERRRDYKFQPTIESDRDTEVNDSAVVLCSLIASRLATSDIHVILSNLGDSAKNWARAPQYLAKPNHPNARRLFFIRTLTGDFLARYRRPMRKETLSIASLFFDCSDLDEATLSRLAPVNGPKRGPV